MGEMDVFDLDITVIESGGEAASLINLTDDGCGSSCPQACVTNAG
jgi:FxLD family lantipeptide